MGYTHYWYRRETLDPAKFFEAAQDFVAVKKELGKLGLKLAGAHGTGSPLIDGRGIIFNGVEKCGHTEADLGITWPSRKAGGLNTEAGVKAAGGVWYAGATLETRTCGGSCARETFHFPRVMEVSDWQRKDAERVKTGLWFECTKTAYKPYDLAVTAALVILKHHFPEMKVSSDGEQKDWFDAMLLVHQVRGYGLSFRLPEGD